MYSGVVVTAIEQNFDCKILRAKDNLVIFCPHELVDSIREQRKTFDKDQSKTLIISYHRSNTDAWHLYANQLKSLNNVENELIYNDLLEFNRMAWVRDYFAKNHFKASHALWVDADSAILNDFDFSQNLFQNLFYCGEFQTLFSDQKGTIDHTLFIVPQEMAWNFYYLNKLIYRDSLGNNQQLSYSQYFAEFLKRHSEQTSLVAYEDEGIAKRLQQASHPILPSVVHHEKTLVVVVNHYQHDTSWINRLHHPAVVYNKNPHDVDKYDLNLPNVGFDTIVYFRYIIDNYDRLPDYMCFLQDDPFFHCMDVIQIVNNFGFDRDFVPMSTSYYLGGHDWKMSEDYAERVGLQYQRPLKMITSCQVIISKEKVLQRPKSFYELLVSTIDQHVKSSENYAIENLWPTILGFNEELVPCMNCKGYGDKQ